MIITNQTLYDLGICKDSIDKFIEINELPKDVFKKGLDSQDPRWKNNASVRFVVQKTMRLRNGR